MKRSLQAKKTLLGVTLLEIMLVLAIAAMVVLMSIRYYQSASNNQKINAALGTATGVIAAGESYLSSVGSYTGISDAALAPYLPDAKMPASPWGVAVSIAAINASSYNISIIVGVAACLPLQNLLTKNNSKLTSSTSCPAPTGNGTTSLVVTVSQ